MTSPLRSLLHLLARPAKADRGRGGPVIQPYRGYGSRREVFLMGRVFRQPVLGAGRGDTALKRDLIDLLRRILRRGIGHAGLTARFHGAEEQVATDCDGYFRLVLYPASSPPASRLWHRVELDLVDREGHTRAPAEVFIPPEQARCVVISDIDDTVMHTGVANKAAMMWRLFVQGAKSRTAFPGVAAFYRALHHGASGRELNPMLYVSRGPWSLYEVLDRFFNMQGIPEGPILFLREWGLTLQRPLPKKAEGHKRDLIRDMLALYDDLPFILIGDSGQHDPETYADIVAEYPGRVKAIYIRHVSRRAGRAGEIDKLAERVVEQGSSLLLASDTAAMAEHAARHRLIPQEAPAEVAGERRAEEAEAEGRPGGTPAVAPKPRRTVTRTTPGETRRAVAEGEVEAALEDDQADGTPPPVEVEVEPAGGKRG